MSRFLVVVGFVVLCCGAAKAAPATPSPDSPPDGDKLVDATVHFTWSNSTDGAGQSLRYEIEVVEVVANGKEARPVAHATGGDGAVGLVIDGLPENDLSWRVRAVNALGEVSPWSRSSTFSVATPPRPKAPPVDTAPGCAVGRGHGFPSLSALAFALFALLVERRRRRR